MINIENAKKVFKEYIKNYDINDGRIALKVAHILRVSSISKKIATSLNLSEEDIKLAELIGLLHDIGRFEQVKKYNTFIDKNSINHGEYGVKILFEDNLIKKFNIEEKYYKIIKTAILNHNKSGIEKGLTEKELLHSKIIKDSDKLDIFYVLLTDTIENTYGCPTLEQEIFSDEIVREFKEEHVIDYKKRETYGDIWISHVAYAFDFYYKSSYIVINENDYINKLLQRVQFKNPKTIETAKELVDIANDYIDEQLK
ncbi:MAG: HD domain-containing protein [Clostridia bacterium]|nr:HD domain-containing protein [Clostridia bacterium]